MEIQRCKILSSTKIGTHYLLAQILTCFAVVPSYIDFSPFKWPLLLRSPCSCCLQAVQNTITLTQGLRTIKEKENCYFMLHWAPKHEWNNSCILLGKKGESKNLLEKMFTKLIFVENKVACTPFAYFIFQKGPPKFSWHCPSCAFKRHKHADECTHTNRERKK